MKKTMSKGKLLHPSNLYIRWLGAFRQGSYTLQESLEYEYTTSNEVACERISKQKGYSHVWRSSVGVLFSSKDIIKSFEGDCWSVETPTDPSRLKKTREGKKEQSQHAECWIRSNAVFSAIVIDRYKAYRQHKGKEYYGWRALSYKARESIKSFLKAHPEVKLYELEGMRLTELPNAF